MDRTLSTALARFDGKSITLLGQIEAEFGNDTNYLDGLLAAIPSDQPHLESGATWLIKDRLERGARLSQVFTDALAATAPALTDWQAQLHLAQSVRHLTPSPAPARVLALEMIELLPHDRPFLRAWSLDALVHLTRHYPEFEDTSADALKAALNDTSASVRARARRLSAEFADAGAQDFGP